MGALAFSKEGYRFYFVVSHVVDRRAVFAAADREVFRTIMRNLEAFTGVRVLTYCLMPDHFQLLVGVPGRKNLVPLSEEEIVAILPLLQAKGSVRRVKEEFREARKAGSAKWQREIMARYEYRRGDLGYFLKDLKQRVSVHINKRLLRSGTLWEGRCKTAAVEGSQGSLLPVAASLDYHPARSGLVASPEDYRWSGYGEAVSGGRKARSGLGMVFAETFGDSAGDAPWRRIRDRYHPFLHENDDALRAALRKKPVSGAELQARLRDRVCLRNGAESANLPL